MKLKFSKADSNLRSSISDIIIEFSLQLTESKNHVNISEYKFRVYRHYVKEILVKIYVT